MLMFFINSAPKYALTMLILNVVYENFTVVMNDLDPSKILLLCFKSSV